MPRKAWLASVVLLAALFGWLYLFRVAPNWLRVIKLRVGVPGLPEEWNGLRVAHLSDFHAGGRGVSTALLWRAREHALAFEPDVIALTGDFYDDGEPVNTGGLWSDWPGNTAVLAVLGNHDYRAGEANLRLLLSELIESGVRVLRNDAAQIDLRGRKAWVVGVDDPYTFRADEAAAFAALPAGEEALLYLAHSPSVISTLPVGRARLILSGHTHGGQIRLLPSGRVPFIGLLRRLVDTGPRREAAHFRGYHWRRGALLLISDGLGLSQLPVRFRTRPQVLLIELVPAPLDGPGCDEATRFVTVLNPESRLVSWLS
jgi:predicted MPP superfamily phosphohydrolase